MWCVVRFGTICTILKVGKTTRRKKCNLQESLPKVTLLHGYFSRFLNCTIVTKSRNTFDMTWTYEVKVLWNTLRPFLHLLFRSVCPEFCSGIGHRIFFCIFLHEVTMSSNLKSDRAGFFLKKKKISFEGFQADRARNSPQMKVFKFHEKSTCGSFTILYIKLQ